MKINENSHLVIDEGEDFNIGFDPNPHVSKKLDVAERILVIHAAPFSSDTKQALRFARDAGNSTHLIIGPDGKDILQTVPFNVGARHTPGKDGSSLAIELPNAGELRESRDIKIKFKGRYREDQYILGSPSNGSRYGDWLLFPTAQLETLVRVVAALKKVYTITDVFTREEIISSTVFPVGPAFPIAQLRERLTRERLLAKPHRSLVLQETARAVHLLSQPDPANPNLLKIPVPQGTPVLIINERFDWYLIAVMKKVNGNPWLMGWAEKNAVKVSTDFIPVVDEDHFLQTSDGRGFQHIEAHKNCFRARPPMEQPDAPKYIIMHYTTGTKIESTINHFTSADPGVATHLVIGRDGRVIQFVPFNLSAHHAGSSWWELDQNLNLNSIGIELDNAGKLRKRKVGGRDVWMSPQEVEIPEGSFKSCSHWRNTKTTPTWEKFPPVQLEVALKIVKALKERYPSIKEILGHDQVNLLNREDPGALFPIEEWRKELFGRLTPHIKTFYLSKTTDLISNFNGQLPNESTKLHATLLHDSQVMVMQKFDSEAIFTKIKVVQAIKAKSLKGEVGWIKTNSLLTVEEDKGEKRKKKNQPPRLKTKIKGNQPFYKTRGGPPTPPILAGPFAAGTRVRKQEEHGKLTLVVVQDTINGQTGFEGWVSSGLVSKKRIQQRTLSTVGVPQGLPLWRHKDDRELGEDAPDRPHPSGDPAVFPMQDKKVQVTKQWQFFIRAINFEMSLQHVAALFGHKKAFTNRPKDDLRADYLQGLNLDRPDPDFDRVRTCALSVMTGVVDGEDLLVEMMDGSQSPPLKPGFEYPERVEDIDLDIYEFTPKTHRHLFFAANITKAGGRKITPFPNGKRYPDWTGDERNYTWMPHVAPSKARVRYPLSKLVQLEPGKPIPVPYKP